VKEPNFNTNKENISIIPQDRQSYILNSTEAAKINNFLNQPITATVAGSAGFYPTPNDPYTGGILWFRKAEGRRLKGEPDLNTTEFKFGIPVNGSIPVYDVTNKTIPNHWLTPEQAKEMLKDHKDLKKE
jgi:hypothetical protein